mmetsp:Transcript_66225/g.113874  ORF Transcript_66225/g.113874 Transcript_66225/m.113874 type:complete len:227 (-) Transcript_66225:145-825(-)
MPCWNTTPTRGNDASSSHSELLPPPTNSVVADPSSSRLSSLPPSLSLAASSLLLSPLLPSPFVAAPTTPSCGGLLVSTARAASAVLSAAVRATNALASLTTAATAPPTSTSNTNPPEVALRAHTPGKDDEYDGDDACSSTSSVPGPVCAPTAAFTAFSSWPSPTDAASNDEDEGKLFLVSNSKSACTPVFADIVSTAPASSFPKVVVVVVVVTSTVSPTDTNGRGV